MDNPAAQRLADDARRYRDDYEGACENIAAMHAAAWGGVVRGPSRGVVEDVVDLYALAEKLAEALRLTQEYIGDEGLPPVPGWSWYDALTAWSAREDDSWPDAERTHIDGLEVGVDPIPVTVSQEFFDRLAQTTAVEDEGLHNDGSPPPESEGGLADA